MDLTLAILCPGLLLLGMGSLLAFAPGFTTSRLRAFPRSVFGAWACYGSGAAWFLWHVWNLSPADLGEYHGLLFCLFSAIGILAIKFAPDFLAVRGLAILTLLAVMPLLMAGYMDYGSPSIDFQKAFLYLCVVLAIWLGAQPWRLRDFIGWLGARAARARLCGGLMAAYGLLLCGVASRLGLGGK